MAFWNDYRSRLWWLQLLYLLLALAERNRQARIAAPVSVTDYAYDNVDRLMRVTQNLPAGEGGNRITETTYYPDGSVQHVKRAVGTPLEQIAAATTYTQSNGVRLIWNSQKAIKWVRVELIWTCRRTPHPSPCYHD